MGKAMTAASELRGAKTREEAAARVFSCRAAQPEDSGGEDEGVNRRWRLGSSLGGRPGRKTAMAKMRGWRGGGGTNGGKREGGRQLKNFATYRHG